MDENAIIFSRCAPSETRGEQRPLAAAASTKWPRGGLGRVCPARLSGGSRELRITYASRGVTTRIRGPDLGAIGVAKCFSRPTARPSHTGRRLAPRNRVIRFCYFAQILRMTCMYVARQASRTRETSMNGIEARAHRTQFRLRCVPRGSSQHGLRKSEKHVTRNMQEILLRQEQSVVRMRSWMSPLPWSSHYIRLRARMTRAPALPASARVRPHCAHEC